MSVERSLSRLAPAALSFLLLGFAACGSADPAPATTQTNPGTLSSGETVHPTTCVYGEPDFKVKGRRVIVTCPDGGPDVTIECETEPKNVRVLDDGRIVADCSERQLPAPLAPL
jgi:hypothetical protein